MMLLLLSALFLGTAVYLAAEAVTFPARRRNELVERASRYGRPTDAAKSGATRPRRRAPGTLTGLIGGLVLRVMPAKTRENLPRKLLSAGLAGKVSPETVIAGKAVLCILAMPRYLDRRHPAHPAADARTRRQFAAEEKAMKAPIKMLVSTAVFIFPALFTVILGPILMNFKNL